MEVNKMSKIDKPKLAFYIGQFLSDKKEGKLDEIFNYLVDKAKEDSELKEGLLEVENVLEELIASKNLAYDFKEKKYISPEFAKKSDMKKEVTVKRIPISDFIKAGIPGSAFGQVLYQLQQKYGRVREVGNYVEITEEKKKLEIM